MMKEFSLWMNISFNILMLVIRFPITVKTDFGYDRQMNDDG